MLRSPQCIHDHVAMPYPQPLKILIFDNQTIAQTEISRKLMLGKRDNQVCRHGYSPVFIEGCVFK